MLTRKLPNAAATKITVTTTAASLKDLIELAASESFSLAGLDGIDLAPDAQIRFLADGNIPTATEGLLVTNFRSLRGVDLSKMLLISPSGSVTVDIQVGKALQGEIDIFEPIGEGSDLSIEDIRYVAASATFTGTADGTFDKPFATIQEAIDFFGNPISSADYNRNVQIQVLDRAIYTEPLTLTTRRYNFVFAGGQHFGGITMNIDSALRFGSTTFPRLDFYSITRNLGVSLTGNFLIQLTGTTIVNMTVNITNIFLVGNVTIADGVNGGPSVSTGTSVQIVLENSTISGTFLGRNTLIGLRNSAIGGSTESQALQFSVGGQMIGATNRNYGTATTVRSIREVLVTPGSTWENVNVEPRWTTNLRTLSDFQAVNVVTNKIRFNVGSFAQATNDVATGAVRQTFHDSASPAANDIILTDSSFGRDSVANKLEYARTEVVIDDATTTTENAVVKLYNVIAGAMTELVRYGSQGGVNIFNVLGALQCDSIINDTGLAAGTYTPTLTGVTNVTATTARKCQYMRVGNTVTVSGQCDIDPAGAGLTVIGISLPEPSDFGTAFECGGVGHAPTVTGHGAAIFADATNNRAELSYVDSIGSNDVMTFTFTYEII